MPPLHRIWHLFRRRTGASAPSPVTRRTWCWTPSDISRRSSGSTSGAPATIGAPLPPPFTHPYIIVLQMLICAECHAYRAVKRVNRTAKLLVCTNEAVDPDAGLQRAHSGRAVYFARPGGAPAGDHG